MVLYSLSAISCIQSSWLEFVAHGTISLVGHLLYTDPCYLTQESLTAHTPRRTPLILRMLTYHDFFWWLREQDTMGALIRAGLKVAAVIRDQHDEERDESLTEVLVSDRQVAPTISAHEQAKVLAGVCAREREQRVVSWSGWHAAHAGF